MHGAVHIPIRSLSLMNNEQQRRARGPNDLRTRQTAERERGESAFKEAVEHKVAVDVYETQESSNYEYGVSDGVILQHKLEFNPREAMEVVNDDQVDLLPDQRVGTGQIQTPALGFLHEIGHFLGAANDGFEKHQARRDEQLPLYHNAEEKRVIDGIETPASERLGEPSRTNHSGIPRTVSSPTSKDAAPRAKPAKNPRNL
mgnify:CR=1 FL=1